MNNQKKHLFVVILVGVVFCSALFSGCGDDAAEENKGVGRADRETLSTPPPTEEATKPLK